MADKIVLTWDEIHKMVQKLEKRIPIGSTLFGIPKNGAVVAALLHSWTHLVEKPEEADYIIDDLIDSGATKLKYMKQGGPKTKFIALIDKRDASSPYHKKWVEFPWETGELAKTGEDHIARLLEILGEDPTREGLRATPGRVMKFYEQVTVKPEFKLTTFKNEGIDEMIIQRGIPFYSLCEHHMVPFFGTATIAYIPAKKIVGLSKLGRTLDHFAAGFQNQERITSHVANYLQKHLEPVGVAVSLTARHLCMEMRGVKKHDTLTTTTHLSGVFKKDVKARMEFLERGRA